MSNVIEFNEFQAFYFEMQKQLGIKNKELEEAISAIQKMKSSSEDFSQFYKDGDISEIEYFKVRKKIKSVSSSLIGDELVLEDIIKQLSFCEIRFLLLNIPLIFRSFSAIKKLIRLIYNVTYFLNKLILLK